MSVILIIRHFYVVPFTIIYRHADLVWKKYTFLVTFNVKEMIYNKIIFMEDDTDIWLKALFNWVELMGV